jgi:hypothetical protein
MKITEQTTQILKQWKILWSDYFLPDVKLDRKEYLTCNEVLEAIWLKWSRKDKCHKWEEDIGGTLFEILDTGEVETLKEYRDKFQFFPTPDDLADFLVEQADIRDDDTILEPSAWKWAILKAIKRKNQTPIVTAVEVNKDFISFIRDLSDNTSEIDFLEYKWHTFSKIIMNPPFSNSQDAKHIVHAYSLLKEGWTLTSIASSSIKTRTGAIYEKLAELRPEFIALPEWSFKESGTMVNSVIVKITK